MSGVNVFAARYILQLQVPDKKLWNCGSIGTCNGKPISIDGPKMDSIEGIRIQSQALHIRMSNRLPIACIMFQTKILAVNTAQN